VSLTRVILSWLAVTAWFTLADLLLNRLRGHDAPRGARPRWLPLIEALLFTLFAALWFGSLGKGGWVLLFLMLGLLLELPPRLRDSTQRAQPTGLALATGVGLVRVLVAAGLLSVIM
jgi:hypothetical protein